MSRMRIWMVGFAALLMCGVSFWSGQNFARSGGTAAATTNPGVSAMPGAPQAKNGEAPEPSSDETTCSLTPNQLKAQRKQLIPGLFQRAEKVEDVPNGLRFRFAHKPKLVTELASLIEKEQVCCSFLSFRLITDKGEGPIILEVTGPPGTAEMLRKL